MVVAELFATLGLAPDTKSWDKGHELIEDLHKALEAYLGYEGLKKVGELVESTVEAAVSAKHLGERLGITAESVQELGYAADVTGSSGEEMAAAMQRLALGLEHAKKGTGPLVDAMSQLHVPIANLRKENLDQNLEEIAEGFKNAPESVNKLGLAMEIFGKNAGPKLLPLLEKGSSGIKELREEAEKLGVVIDEEGIEKAHEFEIEQKKLGATLKGIRNEAVVAMLPALKEMAEGLRDWVAQNREAIATGLKTILEGIAIAFKAIGTVLSWVIDLFKNHQEVVVALGLAFVVLQGQAIASAIATGIAWMLAMAPIVLMVAAIAAVIAITKRMVEYVTGKTVTWKELWNAAIDGAKRLGRAVGDVFEFIANLPVIKQLIKLVHDIDQLAKTHGQRTGKDEDLFREGSLDAIDSVKTGTGKLLTRGANGQVIETNIGDTNVTITGTGLPADQLEALTRKAVKDAHTESIRQAIAAVSGGKR